MLHVLYKYTFDIKVSTNNNCRRLNKTPIGKYQC